MRAYDQKWGERIPVAWPGDTSQRREYEGDLVPLVKIYRDYGLNMLPERASFPDKSVSTEAGILLMNERFRSGRLKVFNTCEDWFEEYRDYHRDADGKIFKERDDLMSATRVGLMQLRSASPVKLKQQQLARTGRQPHIIQPRDPWDDGSD